MLKNIESYIIVFIFVLLLFILYSLLLFIEKKRFNSFFQREKEKANIVNELVLIAEGTKLNMHVLQEYPNLLIYLSQTESIIKKKGFIIDGIEVSTLNKLPDHAIVGFDKAGFCKELFDSPKEILELVASCSEVFGRIYKLSHPIKYCVVETKKNISMRILNLFVKNWSKKLVSKSSNAVNKAKVKTMSYNFVNEPSSLAEILA